MTGIIVDKYPSDSPYIILVAAPVRQESASYLTGV